MCEYRTERSIYKEIYELNINIKSTGWLIRNNYLNVLKFENSPKRDEKNSKQQVDDEHHNSMYLTLTLTTHIKKIKNQSYICDQISVHCCKRFQSNFLFNNKW